ncbi:hypothetical protein SFRURICE_006045 [Spodoptera frugiperda]|nr:hypothetical protein SFRURICE_006045 [Spodoptera frugiperda]
MPLSAAVRVQIRKSGVAFSSTWGKDVELPSAPLGGRTYPSKMLVGWLRAEDQTVLTMHDRAVLSARYSVHMDAPRTWQLRIRPLRAEDRGCYMCQINTQPNMKWQIGCIDVYACRVTPAQVPGEKVLSSCLRIVVSVKIASGADNLLPVTPVQNAS